MALLIESLIGKLASWSGWSAVDDEFTVVFGHPPPAAVVRETRRFFVIKALFERSQRDSTLMAPAQVTPGGPCK